uniref:Uncharacterized protein n=1 Tax=Arundo donax TaxID=35708 RepID=A0A0A9H479_ARUDO
MMKYEYPISSQRIWEILFHSGLPYSLHFFSSSEWHSVIQSPSREDGRSEVSGAAQHHVGPNAPERTGLACLVGAIPRTCISIHIGGMSDSVAAIPQARSPSLTHPKFPDVWFG